METLHGALEAFANADPAARPALDTAIWEIFGTLGAPLILDMAGFSQTVRRRGIVPYLAMVRRMQGLTRPHVESHGGRVVKYEADNLYALFPEVSLAFAAAKAILESCAAEPVSLPEDRITAGVGIDFGPLLEIPGADYFGECVNTAAKLGEDLAAAGEVLLTRAAALRLPATARMGCAECRLEASGVEYDIFVWSPDNSPSPHP